MDLQLYLNEHIHAVEQRLQLLLDQKTAYPELIEAARYSLFSGGKRLRPILTLAACRSLDGNEELALTPACTLELMHTFSLIHDDLPCMDNDDFRRGKPTLHRAYPEALALLTGDFFVLFAFEILTNLPHLSSTIKVQLMKTLAENAGGKGMIGGQVIDIRTTKTTDLEDLHIRKTGALIGASLKFGALIAEADRATTDALEQFGREIGLAFQIVDDILDVTSSFQKRGQTIASDIKNDKVTSVTLLGVDGAQARAEELLASAQDRLHQLPLNTTLLNQLANMLVHRTQ